MLLAIALIKSAHQLVVLSANRCARVVFSACQGSGKSRVQIGYVTIFWSSMGIVQFLSLFILPLIDGDKSTNVRSERARLRSARTSPRKRSRTRSMLTWISALSSVLSKVRILQTRDRWHSILFVELV